jgi:hypothetical protein
MMAVKAIRFLSAFATVLAVSLVISTSASQAFTLPGGGGVTIGSGGGGISIPGVGTIGVGSGGNVTGSINTGIGTIGTGGGTVNVPGLGGVSFGQNGGSVTIPGYGTFNTNGNGQVTIPGLGTFTFSNGGWSFSTGLGGAGGCYGGGIGAVLCNVVAGSQELPFFLSAIAYLAGLVLGILGIVKLKDHVINPNNTPLSDSVKRFLAGGAFLALPTVITAAYNTVAGMLMGPNMSGFNTPGTSGAGLDAMITALMADIWGPMHVLLAGFCYLAGAALIMIGISRLLKTAQEGPRGPAGIGTVMTFLVGGALLSVDSMMGAFTGSLFSTDNVATYATLSYAQGLGASANHVHSVLSAVLAFMMIVGWISFIRGFFIIRDVAEGNGQASLMAGMTHLFGGALAVNLGPVLNAVQSTFGLTGVGIVFS